MVDNRVYYTKLGESVQLEENYFGEGKEGKIYNVIGNSNFVAKILNRKDDNEEKEILKKYEKEKKIKILSNLKNDNILNDISYPQKLLYDENGFFVGYIMKKFDKNEFFTIESLFDINKRKRNFPNCSIKFLLQVATKIASLVALLHTENIVIGDINMNNILVNKNGNVKIIDTDSFQLIYNFATYRCNTKFFDYAAPELQKSNSVHTKNTDNFALAILIFQLLIGSHPYHCTNYDLNEDVCRTAMQNGYYAYGDNAEKYGLKVLESNLIRYNMLLDSVKTLFDKAFLSNNRPTPQEWIKELNNFLFKLKKCSKNPNHYHVLSSYCIWCEILDKQQGVDEFPYDSRYAQLTYKKEIDKKEININLNNNNLPNHSNKNNTNNENGNLISKIFSFIRILFN